MSNSQLNLNQDTLRQRRNLVVTASLLIFIKTANVVFGDSLVLFGATLKIGQPSKIHAYLLVLLLYYLWRYYQYFATDNAYEALLNQFSGYMSQKVSLRIVKMICQEKGVGCLSGNYLYKDLKKHRLFKYIICATVPGTYNPATDSCDGESFTTELPLVKIEAGRVLAAISFIFRGRIITDYFLPYFLVTYAIYLQFL